MMRSTSSAAIRLACVTGVAIALAGCGSADIPQFNKPRFDVTTLIPPDPDQFARKPRATTAVSPSDLVDGSGYCPGAEPAIAGTPSEQASDPQAAAAAVAAPPSPRGVALEMTECEVVRAAGRPAEVQISTDERGDRTVTMVYASPERPIYRFVAGRLKTVERGAEPAPEPTAKKPPPRRQQRRQEG